MIIDDYRFGAMTVNGREYQQDLIILPDKIIPNWWRKEGHFLQLADLQKYITDLPELLIIGTGKFGMMRVDPKLLDWLKKQDIQYRIDKTGKAVRNYNDNTDKTKLVAAFHLTC
jgi:hypothetical protein